MSIQLVGRARRAGLVFTPREVFQHKTPAALAATARVPESPAVATQSTDTADSTSPPRPLISLSRSDQETIEARIPQHGEVLPLAAGQEGLLFHAVYDDAAPDVYMVQLVFDLDGSVDATRLRAAAEGLLRRYPHVGAGLCMRVCRCRFRWCLVRCGCRGGRRICGAGGGGGTGRLRAMADGGPSRPFRSDAAAVAAVRVVPLRRRTLPSRDDESPHPPGRLVHSAGGTGSVHPVRAAGSGVRTAQAHAVPRLPRVVRIAGSGRGIGGMA
ncbi:hypothetical protein D3C57_143710 [Streptomyces rapamycinicus NRRL 5491]|uniref:Uncharacterized protein n=1 Tax=Streptomyces rapamycinicus (strain ATCC 29253 / DSM 41530 / NRRL 5491 / AYB-994) TaxID=1343740 RepID=A0A3L8R0X4_STRRN|nr:hypothetical protein D3C57_143710 [Streptomyces rapamycinicus NRRL 5491]